MSFGQARWSSHEEGTRTNCQPRTSVLMSGSSSEIWKGLEEDLNQRFFALRSSPVRSHCATNGMAQSQHGANPRLCLKCWRDYLAPPPPLLRSHPYWNTLLINSGSLSNTGPESCSNPFSSQWLMVLPQVRSPDHSHHLSIPPFHPPPLTPSSSSLLFPVSIVIQTAPVCNSDFKSIYLSVSLLCW